MKYVVDIHPINIQIFNQEIYFDKKFYIVFVLNDLIQLSFEFLRNAID